MKFLKTIVFCLLPILSLHAQEERFSSTIFVALESSLFGNSSLGTDLAYNPAYAMNNWFSLEGQLSIFRMKGETWSSKPFKENGINLFAGGRFYLLSRENYRIYYNALIGVTRYKHIKAFNPIRTDTILSGSTGIYYTRKFWVIGLAYESVAYIGFKVGVHF